MKRLVLTLIAFVVLSGCSIGAGLVIRAYLAEPGRAEAGDCLADDAGAAVPYRRVDCDDKAARYTVLTAAEADGNPCVGVPGASRLYRFGGKAFCVGRKGADPAKAANIAENGDCLRIGRDVEAERLDCADPMANVKVLRRLTNVYVGGSPYLNEGPCVDVAGTQLVYSYAWQTDPPAKPIIASLGTLVELVFCLVRVNEPPPAVPDAPQDCRYVTGAAVLAAVDATSGARHTAVNAHMAGPLGCAYQLTRDDRSAWDSIYIKLNADTSWPPGGTQEFDLDATMAAWHDSTSSGGGTLYVDRPTGRFEIVLVVGNGFTAPRETAVAVYRAAAEHVP